MSDENLKYYIDKLKKFNPVYIDGYPSAIYILAKYLERNGAVGYVTPKVILTTAETLLDNQRDVIERIFKTKVYNQYASTEGAPFITECEYGNLHINPESGIFEFLKPDNTPADFGEIGQLVVTSFLTKAMPLIRYKIGDLAIKKAGDCDCGRKMPLVEKIVGRVEDMLYTKQRGYVGRLDPIFKKLPNSIIEAQIIQDDVDQITILIVPDYTTFQSSHLDTLEEELKYRLGSDIHITKEIVERIPRGPAGKFKAVISKLPLTFE
jgi:phenylacetate-CoA ligase